MRAALTGAVLLLGGCHQPWFGPGGFDQAQLEGDAPPGVVESFHRADEDGNGLIDSSELRGSSEAIDAPMSQLDTNRDREISESEYIRGMRDRRK